MYSCPIGRLRVNTFLWYLGNIMQRAWGLQTASDQKGVTLTLPAVQMMMSQAQSRGNPKSFKPPKTPVGQCFEHRPRNALSERSSSSQMTRSQKRRWQMRKWLVEWRLSTLSQQGWLESRKRPTLRGEKEPEKEETQDVDMKDSGTFKSEGKTAFRAMPLLKDRISS